MFMHWFSFFSGLFIGAAITWVLNRVGKEE